MRWMTRVLVLAVVITSARGAHADDTDADAAMYACSKPKGEFTISFKPEVELKELAAWAMGVSCRKIVYSAALASRSAKVTMLTPGALSFTEAWGLFHTALRTMGLAMVKKGQALEIVESASAKDEALAITKQFPEGGGDMIRLLLRPEHVDVEDMRQALELVKSKNGMVSPLAKLGALLITDDAAHIARMSTLVKELDRPAAGDGVFAIPVEHVDATSLVETLNQLVGETKTAAGVGGKDGAGGSGGPPKLVAAPRVNAVFVVGSAAEYLRVRAIAKALDLDLGDTARIQSFHLRNALAKDVAAALAALGDGAFAADGVAGQGGAQATTARTKFAADEASNTLLVLASPRDALAIRALIEDLDRPRRQVYVEVLVLEVEASNTREVGVSYHGGKNQGDDSAIVGAFQTDGLSTVDPKTALGASGLVGGVLGKPLSGMLGNLLGTTVPSFGMLVKLAGHESRLDILASTHLTMVDNKPGTISVGANIPFKSSQASAPGSTFPTNPNIDRQKVAMSLVITPHVAPAEEGTTGDSVRLEVKFESNQIGKEDYGGLGPTWKERLIDTSVILRDQESIVLGGMVDERIEDTVDKIPILGDIPLLGILFRSTKKIRLKSNMLVVLTPHLIDDSVAGRAILERRMRERDEFMSSTLDLEARVLEPDIDYRTKRGLVAEIDATVARIEADRAALEAAGAVKPPPDGRIDEPQTDK